MAHFNYDPLQLPPDWTLAENHARATRPGRHLPSQSNQVCPCCMNFIQKIPIPYSEDNKELAFLGNGFPLFYNFFKFTIIMLGALVLNSSIVSMDLNLAQNTCIQTHSSSSQSTHRLLSSSSSSSGSKGISGCVSGVANTLSYVNNHEVPTIRVVLKCTVFVTQLLLLLYLRQKQISLTSYYDQRSIKVSDFALRFKNVPTGNTDNQFRINALINYMSELDKFQSLEVKELLLIENLQEYFQKEDELHKMIQDKRAAYAKLNSNTPPLNISILNNKQDLIREDMAEIKQRMAQNEDHYFVGKCFVIFESQQQRDRAQHIINHRLTEKEVRQFFPNYDRSFLKKLKAVRAREPNEIIWRNIHKPRKERITAILIGWALSIVCLMTITVIIFLLLRAKGLIIEHALQKYNEDPQMYKKEHDNGIALGYGSVILIVLFNKFFMPWACHHVTDHQKHANGSQYEYSFGLKYTLGVFFTTALMTIAVEAYFFGNYVHNFGVVEAESLMFVLNSFVPPILWIINPFDLIARYKRYRLKGSPLLTQTEAHALMEEPPYEMGKRYSQIIKTMWFTFLYAYLIPAGAILSLVGMCLYYLADKRVLFRMSSVKRSISSTLAQFMLKMLDFTLLFYASGCCFFDAQIRQKVGNQDWVMLSISIVYLLLPWNRILGWLFSERHLEKRELFSKVREELSVTYKNSYPPNRNKGVMMSYLTISKQEKVEMNSSRTQ